MALHLKMINWQVNKLPNFLCYIAYICKYLHLTYPFANFVTAYSVHKHYSLLACIHVRVWIYLSDSILVISLSSYVV